MVLWTPVSYTHLKLVVSEKDDKRLKQSVATAMQQGEGLIMIYDAS